LASAKPPAKPGPAKPGPAAPARYWLVDPLDGTKEFLRRNDHFTVNIALIRDRRPVLGVVHAPALGATYWTPAPGRAVVADGAGRPGAISARAAPAAGLTVVGSRAHGRGAKFEAYLARHKVARRLTMGSAIKFCLIARGLADLYPRFGPTMEWDTAAGQAVLTAAGGRVETVDGAALGYGKPGFKNPPFIARGRD
ncbi:MAG: 3'(2'),5'-bisphosphate nucleotidase CysQ, partial [Kiloniellales bacterium]